MIKDSGGIRRAKASGCSEAELRYSAIFEQSPDGILIIDAEGKILDFNKAAHADLGYTREEFAKLSISDIDPVESPEEIRARIQRVMGQKKAEFEVKHQTKSGRIRDVLIICQTVVLSGRTVIHAIWRDITDQRAAEKALAESEAKYRDLFENAGDAVFVLDSELRYVDVNRKGLDLLGYTREELLGRQPFDFVPEQQRPRSVAEFAKLRNAGSYETFEGRMLTKDGRWIDVEVSSTAIFRDGVFAGSRDILRDISSRKKAEEALRESEKLYRNLIETTLAVAWEVDLATLRFTYISPQIMNISGFSPEQWTDFSFWAERIYPEDREYAVNFCQTETAKGLDHAFEYRMVTADNGIIWIRDVVSVIKNNGKAVSLRGYLFDITERKKAEDKLRQSEAFIRNILDTVDEGFIIIDRDFRILTANKAYCSQVGEPCDSVIGRYCYEVSHKTSRPCNEEGEECAVLHVFETGEPHTVLHKHPDAKGAILYVETKAFPIKDGTGAVTSVIETVNNITEKHLLEEEQLKSQKLEAIGTLAGGIAHDFNNLLQGVFGYISMAKLTLDQKERSLSMLEQAEKALHMSVNLTTQLLTFSKGGKPVKKKVRLKSVVENSVRFALSGSSVDFRTKFDKDLWAVDADEGQIGQVVQNIVLNADQAMPAGGTIEIAVKNVRAPGEGLPGLLEEGRYIEISVKDSGIGIPETYVTRIFDPYFTTKEKGSGLGLATSYSIIRNHGGLIDVKSRLGKGSTFFVYLPAVATREERVVTASAIVGTGRKGRVLVMDDEELIRNIVGIMLKELGHEVEFAENGEEALAKYREALSSDRRFDIVILDLTVRGGLGGEDTLRELFAMDPEVKAVVSSGYIDSETIAEYESRGFSACLTKPYEVDALGDILNVLLK